MRRFAVSWLALVLSSSLASTVGIARAESIAGRVRLGFESGLMEHQAFTLVDTANDGFGSPEERETDVKSTTLSIGSLPFGPLVGYGISNNVLLVGQLSIVHQNRKFGDNGSTDTFGAGVSATIAYVADTGSVRPFVGPILGFEHAGSDSGQSSYSENAFAIGAQVGLLGFAASSFSIDPSVVAAYSIGGGTQQSFSSSGDPNSGAERDYDIKGFSIGLRLAMSGWIGGEGKAPDAGPERDLDAMPAYARPPGPAWGQPPSQQPAYPGAVPGYAPPGAAPTYPPAGQPPYSPPPDPNQPAPAPPASSGPAFPPSAP